MPERSLLVGGANLALAEWAPKALLQVGLVSAVDWIHASGVARLRLLMTLALWLALVGFAHAAEAPSFQPSTEHYATDVAANKHTQSTARDAWSRDLPAAPEQKAKHEQPSLEKLAMALGFWEAWQTGDAVFRRLVPLRSNAASYELCLVPNARAPPAGR